MGELQTAIHDRLWLVPDLVDDAPAGLGFRVFDRWLLAPPARGATPEAFDDAQGGRLRRSVIVLDPDEAAHPGRTATHAVEHWDAFPVLYLFAEAHRTGRDAIERAYRAIKTDLHGWQPILPAGDRPLVQVPPSRSGTRDDDSFPGNVRTEIRLRVTGARRVGPAP